MYRLNNPQYPSIKLMSRNDDNFGSLALSNNQGSRLSRHRASGKGTRMNIAPLFLNSAHPGSDRRPVMITPQTDCRLQALRSEIREQRSNIDRLLLQHGALLFRGFHLESAEDFKSCAECLGAEPFGYIGGNSPRSRVAADVYTSTEYPASEAISLHNEMSYLPRWPRRLLFYSLLPARSGGQTPLALSAEVLRAMPADIVASFRQRKLTYIRHFQSEIPLGKSWQETYATRDRSEIEALIASQGSSCSWLSDGVLRVMTQCEALTSHPRTGEEVWFNQAEQWHPSAMSPEVRALYEEMVGAEQLPHDCRYGDGTPIESEVLERIRGALTGCKLSFDWQPRDLLVLDNVLIMHGRESFQGERKLLTYLSST